MGLKSANGPTAIIRSGGNEIDYVQQVLDFNSLPVSRGGDDNHRWQTVHGYVRPQSRWRQPERGTAIARLS